MPLWKIYHPPGAFSETDKAELAESITAVYGAVMPRFYVGIIFEPVDPTQFFVGGKPAGQFVRIVMEHIARSFPSLEASRRFIDRINAILKPYVADRGLDWEFHVDETPFDYWSINGFYPPRAGTPDEVRWREENRASPRTHE
ncbi:MAG: tautomerase family protein [Phenylobacterium sp.]|uniref:tautomerase family protein n=1 Tax=Phenylobacterium sp. TaxID=1871053 RepID=UPI0025E93477|nr:tautomerase family protein [Phenylobacterium sp.]MCA3725920.1 tautomerase family protein [Phenylobacterium sp.]MCA3738734.1 tautomerase family protein [Phenylobacterium sp.]MCA3752803.1 tautomerase family protein [Phenylobacterium sp.]MCA3753168.1 tautomerase family protein [Phenylobacterium sp.]MCA4915392.1 tautomerase family protein [Phenylobacterium sp.]